MPLTETNILPCAVCKRMVYFSGAGTNIINCGSCGTFVYRNTTGETKELSVLRTLNTASVIQPGTTGVWQNKPFTVTGRFRAWFNESVASYWTVRMNDGSINWLCENNGLYFIYKPVNLSPKTPVNNLRNPDIGSQHELYDGGSHVLYKKRTVTRWEAEGEIYLPETSYGFTILEFKNNKSGYLSFFLFNNDLYAFRVHPVMYSMLGLQQLLPFSTTGKEFACKNCGTQVNAVFFPFTQSCTCKQCGAFYEIKRGIDAEYLPGNKDIETLPFIPLGAKGNIDNVTYEVTGVMLKEENSPEHPQWTEYTLFNPENGFAFLSEYNGNWMLLKEKAKTPVIYKTFEKTIRSKEKEFRLYSKYSHKVVAAAGEFPGNVFSNTKTESCEYIAPPEIWVYEKNPEKGINWYGGRHISTKELTTAFGITNWPHKTGIGVVQPLGLTDTWKIVLATFAGLLLLLAAHGLFALTKQNREVFTQTFSFNDSSAKITYVTPKFEFEKRSSNLLLNIWAPVTNNWFELNATLVNAQTGKEYNLQQGVEYYTGYSGGEYWKEGSTDERAWFKRIPRGTYFLQLEGYRDVNATFPVKEYSVTAIYDVAGNRNFYFPMFFYLGFGLLVALVGYYREKSRWSGSHYTPYSE